MARFNDVMASQNLWIHDLARAESNPDSEKLLQMERAFDPQQLVEESTIEFLGDLRQQFADFTKAFNHFSEGGTKFQEIKLYSVAQTAADFMLFRNQIKLIIANAAHGLIQISFVKHNRGVMDVNGTALQVSPTSTAHPAVGVTHEILAQIGPFREVFWTFQGERVSAFQIAKYYFTEFSRLTRDARRASAGNQVLLEQIKALLHERGLDL